MGKKPRLVYSEAQMVLDIANLTEIPVASIRKVFKAWNKVALNEFLNNRDVPIPGGTGYIYPSLTARKPRNQYSPLIKGEVVFEPKLKTQASFSDPWKDAIKTDPRAENLIKKLLEESD